MLDLSKYQVLIGMLGSIILTYFIELIKSIVKFIKNKIGKIQIDLLKWDANCYKYDEYYVEEYDDEEEFDPSAYNIGELHYININCQLYLYNNFSTTKFLKKINIYFSDNKYNKDYEINIDNDIFINSQSSIKINKEKNIYEKENFNKILNKKVFVELIYPDNKKIIKEMKEFQVNLNK